MCSPEPEFKKFDHIKYKKKKTFFSYFLIGSLRLYFIKYLFEKKERETSILLLLYVFFIIIPRRILNIEI